MGFSCTMSSQSKRVQFQGSRRLSHPFSIHGSQPNAEDKYCSAFHFIFSLLGLVTSLVSFIGLCFSGGEAEICMVIVCLFELMGLIVFMLPQLCIHHITKYFVSGPLCLGLFYLLSCINISNYHIYGELPKTFWPWYIPSIPLYLVPIAFAIGIVSFYCAVVLKTDKLEQVTDNL